MFQQSLLTAASRGRWSRASIVCFAVFGPLVGLCGCSVAGSWQVVSTDPPQVPFPVETVSFDGRHRYVATESSKQGPKTSSGLYRLKGSQLEIREIGKTPRTYRVRRRWDNTLVLTYEENGYAVSATLQRRTAPDKSGGGD